MQESLTPFGNREQRRKDRSLHTPPGSVLAGQYNKYYNLLGETIDGWNQTVDEQDNNSTKVIYKGRPFISDWLEVRRELPLFLERAQLAGSKDQVVIPEAALNRFHEQDFYSKELGGRRFLKLTMSVGTSFFDIEQMLLIRSNSNNQSQWSLQTEDIRRINRMFRAGESPVMFQAMIYLATQEFARPEQKNLVSPVLHPLRDRLVAFFDYYKDLMFNFDMGVKDEFSFCETLAYTRPGLPLALGVYMPARLGITPSSAIKLFQTRAELSLSPFFWRSSGVLEAMEMGAEEAHREKNLPANLERYQHYDEKMDNEVLKQLSRFYGQNKLTEAELEALYNNSDNLIDKFIDLYFKDLYSDVMRSPHRQLNFKMPEGHVISNITLSCQNRQTLILILHLADGITHLTLEIGQGNKFYGMPAKLVTDHEHFIKAIFSDVLPPILEEARKKHPNREPLRISDYRKVEQSEVQITGIDQQLSLDEAVRLPVPKRKHHEPSKILTPLAQYLAGPKPVNATELPESKYHVICSRSSIIEKLGGHPRPKDVDKIMRHIRMFELGQAQPKMIDWSGGKRLIDRVGDFRIVYNSLGGKNCALEAIGDREYIYTHYGDFKID